MQSDCAVDAPPKRAKTRLRTLDDLDNRTRAAQYAHRLVAGLESDLGGASEITVGQRELIKRAALLGAFIEDHEARWLRNEAVAIDDYLAAINAQRRVLTTLGLDRRARDVTPEADPLFCEFVKAFNEPESAR